MKIPVVFEQTAMCSKKNDTSTMCQGKAFPAHGSHPGSKNLVSVIIPAYNAERFIGETIESALSQTHPELEIIVVNDGSTDGTMDVVNRFNAGTPRITMVNQRRSGVAAARNTGIRHAHGEFIAPLDSDDLWYPEKISRQMNAMAGRDQKIGLVYTWNINIDEQSRVIEPGSTGRHEGYVFSKLLVNNFIGCASVPLIRKSCLEEVGGYSTAFYAGNAQGCEDLDLHLRIAERFQFAVVPKILVGYRKRRTSMSMDHRQMFTSFELTLERIHRRRPHLPKRYLNISYAYTMLYLDGISARYGDYLGSIRYLCIALIRCPLILSIPMLRRRYIWRFKKLVQLLQAQ